MHYHWLIRNTGVLLDKTRYASYIDAVSFAKWKGYTRHTVITCNCEE